MATKTWYKYRVFCSSENQYVYKTQDTDTHLTSCPNNASHTIVANSSNKVDSISDNTVVISLENTGNKTGGAYTLHGRTFTAYANTTTVDAFIMPIPITVLSGLFSSRPELEGDVVSVHILPQNPSTVGAITQNVSDGVSTITVSSTVLYMIELTKVAQIQLLETSSGRTSNKLEVRSVNFTDNTITFKTPINTENGQPLLASNTTLVKLDTNIIGIVLANYTTDSVWIYVSPTVIQYVKKGYWINLFQNTMVKTDLRMVVDIDTVNNRVKLNEPFNVAISLTNTTVYVQMTIIMVHDYELESDERVVAGDGTIGGAYLSNVVILFKYKRNTYGDVKIRYKYEFLY